MADLHSMRVVILSALTLFGLSNFAEKRDAPLSDINSFSQLELTPHHFSYEGRFYRALALSLRNLTRVDLETAYQIVKNADRQALEQGTDVFRVLGFIVAESYAQVDAISPVGARGLMQIMPATGEVIALARYDSWEGEESLHEIDLNISYGVWYYRHLLRLFDGDEHAAIAAYNWGPGNISWRLRHSRELPEVYPSKVLAAQEKVEKEFNYEFIGEFRRGQRRNFYLTSSRAN